MIGSSVVQSVGSSDGQYLSQSYRYCTDILICTIGNLLEKTLPAFRFEVIYRTQIARWCKHRSVGYI